MSMKYSVGWELPGETEVLTENLLEGLGQLKKSKDLIGTWTHDLPACSIAPQRPSYGTAIICYLLKTSAVSSPKRAKRRMPEDNATNPVLYADKCAWWGTYHLSALKI
jgi:hypothetical protein